MNRIVIVGATVALAASMTSTLALAGYEVSIQRDMGYKVAGGTLSKVGATNSDYGFPVNENYKYFEPILEGVKDFWPEEQYAVVTMVDGTSYLQGKGFDYQTHNLTELPFNVTDFAADGERAFFLTDEGGLMYTLHGYEMYKDRYDDAMIGPGRDIVGNIVSLDASDHNVALLNDEGTLYTYGDNRIGVNGNMDGANRFTPVDNIVAPVTSYAGDAGSWIALDVNGTVWGWGSNSTCMLTDAIPCNTATLTPQVIGHFPDAVKVSLTNNAAYVLDGNGDLYLAGTVGLFTISDRYTSGWMEVNKAIKQYNNQVTDIVTEGSIVYAKSGDCWYGKGSYHAGVGDITNIRATGEFFEVECNISDYDAGIVPVPTLLPATPEPLVCPIEEPVVEIEYVNVEVPVIEYVNVEVPYEVEVTVTEYVEVPVEVIVEVPVEVVREVEVIVEVPVEVKVPYEVIKEVEVVREVEVIKTVTEIVEVAVPVTPNYTYKELKQMLKEKRTERKEENRVKKEKHKLDKLQKEHEKKRKNCKNKNERDNVDREYKKKIDDQKKKCEKLKSNNGHGNGGEGDEVDNGEKYDPSNPGKSKKKK